MSALLMNLAVIRDAEPGKPLHYRVVDNGRVREYDYAVAEQTEIIAVEDQLVDGSSGAFTVTDLYTRQSPSEPLTWTDLLPQRLSNTFASSGSDLGSVLR